MRSCCSRPSPMPAPSRYGIIVVFDEKPTSLRSSKKSGYLLAEILVPHANRRRSTDSPFRPTACPSCRPSGRTRPLNVGQNLVLSQLSIAPPPFTGPERFRRWHPYMRCQCSSRRAAVPILTASESWAVAPRSPCRSYRCHRLTAAIGSKVILVFSFRRLARSLRNPGLPNCGAWGYPRQSACHCAHT